MKRITGSREAVTQWLWAADPSGTRLVMTVPTVLPDGRWSVVIDERPLVPQPPVRPAPKTTARRLSPRALAAAVAVGLATLAGLAIVATFALQWVIAHAAQILGALIVTAVIVSALGSLTRDGHCSGPNSGH